MNDTIRGLICYKLDRARETYQASKELVDNGLFYDANNRIYYAAFYAISAVLLIDGYSTKKHNQAIGYFNKNYVATGVFKKEYGRFLNTINRIRVESDYNEMYVIDKEETIKNLTILKEFIEAISTYAAIRLNGQNE